MVARVAGGPRVSSQVVVDNKPASLSQATPRVAADGVVVVRSGAGLDLAAAGPRGGAVVGPGAPGGEVRSVGVCSQTGAEAPRWFMSNSGHPRGVTLVFHGLNLRPSRMDFIARDLASYGFDSYRATLPGHDGNMGAFKKTSRDENLRVAAAAYDEAAARARELGVPLHLVGFSLGGLVANDLMRVRPDVHFDKMVLFAPAIVPRLFTHPLELLRWLPSLVIPSWSPQDYRANPGTPIAAYSALFDSVKSVNGTPCAHANVPTVVFLDPKDELVSTGRMKAFIAKQGLTKWDLVGVANDKSELPKPYHHLITDPEAVGRDEWRTIESRMLTHLGVDDARAP